MQPDGPSVLLKENPVQNTWQEAAAMLLPWAGSEERLVSKNEPDYYHLVHDCVGVPHAGGN